MTKKQSSRAKRCLQGATLSLALAAGSAFAAHGQAMQPYADGTALVIAAQSTVSVENDQAEVRFVAAETQPTLEAATREVILVANAGMKHLKSLPLKAQYKTQTMSSYPIYNTPKDPKATPQIVGWRVQQRIEGVVSGADAAAKLAQEGMQFFAVDSVYFGLSTEAKAKAQAELTQKVIDAAHERVFFASHAMGIKDKKVRIKKLDFENEGGSARPVYSMMRSSADAVGNSRVAPLPVFEAGTTELTMRVTAHVEIAR